MHGVPDLVIAAKQEALHKISVSVHLTQSIIAHMQNIHS
jgi:hypothetical protein